MRLDNRLPSSNANYYVAMAATLLGVEYAARKNLSSHEHSSLEKFRHMRKSRGSFKLNAASSQEYPSYPLPRTRLDALKLFKAGQIGEKNSPVKTCILNNYFSVTLE